MATPVTPVTIVYYLSRATSLQTERFRVKNFVGDCEIVEFVEKGHGTGRQTWPVLREAIQRVRRQKARLLVAKIGRLRWNVSFLRLLQDIKFDCCDYPDFNEHTIHIQLAQAQWRAQQASHVSRDKPHQGYITSAKRKDARFKAGVRLGGRNSARLRRIRANNLYTLLKPRMNQLRAEGKTYEQVAGALNEDGYRTTIGTVFNGPTVFRILKR